MPPSSLVAGGEQQHSAHVMHHIMHNEVAIYVWFSTPEEVPTRLTLWLHMNGCEQHFWICVWHGVTHWSVSHGILAVLHSKRYTGGKGQNNEEVSLEGCLPYGPQPRADLRALSIPSTVQCPARNPTIGGLKLWEDFVASRSNGINMAWWSSGLKRQSVVIVCTHEFCRGLLSNIVGTTFLHMLSLPLPPSNLCISVVYFQSFALLCMKDYEPWESLSIHCVCIYEYACTNVFVCGLFWHLAKVDQVSRGLQWGWTV